VPGQCDANRPGQVWASDDMRVLFTHKRYIYYVADSTPSEMCDAAHESDLTLALKNSLISSTSSSGRSTAAKCLKIRLEASKDLKPAIFMNPIKLEISTLSSPIY
jgi:hypothetical protein